MICILDNFYFGKINKSYSSLNKSDYFMVLNLFEMFYIYFYYFFLLNLSICSTLKPNTFVFFIKL